jgi:hypothetical protein
LNENISSSSGFTSHLIPPQGIVFNVTTKVDKAIADEWLQWILQVHAPQIILTRCFTHFKVLQLLEVDDAEGPTYAIQYFADTLAGYERYLYEFAAHFSNQSLSKWNHRVMDFGTVMKVVK